MTITDQIVDEVAKLAGLRLSEDELTRTTHQLSAILAHFALLDRLDTAEEGAAPPVPRSCPLREDSETPGPRDQQERIREQAPKMKRGYFVVPRFIDR